MRGMETCVLKIFVFIPIKWEKCSCRGSAKNVMNLSDSQTFLQRMFLYEFDWFFLWLCAVSGGADFRKNTCAFFTGVPFEFGVWVLI